MGLILACFWCEAQTQKFTHTSQASSTTLGSSRLAPGKLSPSPPRGVPPNLIVTFPYRTRWHLVDILSPIILSGKRLFLISYVMVYRNSEGPWWGQGLRHHIKHQWSKCRCLRARVYFLAQCFGCFTSLRLILVQRFFLDDRQQLFLSSTERMGQCKVVEKPLVFYLSAIVAK